MRKLLILMFVALIALLPITEVIARPQKALRELPGKRTGSSKTWQNSDGSFCSQVFTGPIHYRDDNGNWQDIDSSFGPVAKKGFWRSVTKNPLKVHVGGNRHRGKNSVSALASSPYAYDEITLEADGGSLSFACDMASNPEPVVAGNKLTYSDAWPSVDLQYTVMPDGLKEDIILKHYTSVAQFTCTISHDGLAIEKQPDGSITFTNSDGIACFFIPAPYMYDADGNQSHAVSLTIESTSENSTVLSVVPDTQWLAQAAYPVVVDPTVYSGGCSGQSAYIDTDNPPYGSVGTWHSGSLIKIESTHRAAYVKWTMPDMPPVIVISANMILNNPTGQGNVEMKRVMSPWTALEGYSVSTLPSVESSAFVSMAWLNYPANDEWLKDLLQDWMDSPNLNYGVRITGTSSDPMTFDGSYYCGIEFDYQIYTGDTTPPTTPNISIASASSNSIISASWSASTDSGSGLWQYKYGIGTAPGLDNIVNWTSVDKAFTSVTKTGLGLIARLNYYFSVKAIDKAGNVSEIACSEPFQCPVGATKIIYVAEGGTGDGSTYINPKSTIQAGVTSASAGDQVWVAAGTYNERITTKAGVAIYGGFPTSFTGLTGTNDWDIRNFGTNVTTISGTGLSGYVVSSTGTVGALRVIDGFHIVNGAMAGIYCNGSCMVISNNVIDNNIGSGIRCVSSNPALGSSVLITNNKITNNSNSQTVYAYAGGISCIDTYAIILDNEITGNHSVTTSGVAGGVCLQNGGMKTCVVSNNVITNNTTSTTTVKVGSGICCYSADAEITNNHIENNSAASFAGGIYCYGTSSSCKTTIANNIVADNTTTGTGGGQIAISGIPSDEVYRRGAYITNNTVVGTSQNSCIYCGPNATSPVIRNNILASGSFGVYNASTGTPTGGANFVSSDVMTPYQPIGIIVAGPIPSDPLFIDAANRNYHLSADSPCIDAGDDTVVQAEWKDIDAENRQIYHAESDSQVDIGADEFTQLTVSINQASDQEDPTNDSPLNFSVAFSAPVNDFDEEGDVIVSGTAGGSPLISINREGDDFQHYNVQVSGMTSGDVEVAVPAGAVHNAAGVENSWSTYSDNKVRYDIAGPDLNFPPQVFLPNDATSITVYGIATDSGTEVSSVEVKIGSGEWQPAIYDSTNQNWSYSWQNPITGPVSLRATDSLGNLSVTSLDVTVIRYDSSWLTVSEYLTRFDEVQASWVYPNAVSTLKYAIGTAPCKDDVCSWEATASPSDTEVSLSNLDLEDNTTYYFSLEGLDESGNLDCIASCPFDVDLGADVIELDSSPSIQPNIGDLVTITATLYDCRDNPVEGRSITFETMGIHESTTTATTDANGIASMTFSCNEEGYVSVIAHEYQPKLASVEESIDIEFKKPPLIEVVFLMDGSSDGAFNWNADYWCYCLTYLQYEGVPINFSGVWVNDKVCNHELSMTDDYYTFENWLWSFDHFSFDFHCYLCDNSYVGWEALGGLVRATEMFSESATRKYIALESNGTKYMRCGDFGYDNSFIPNLYTKSQVISILQNSDCKVFIDKDNLAGTVYDDLAINGAIDYPMSSSQPQPFEKMLTAVQNDIDEVFCPSVPDYGDPICDPGEGDFCEGDYGEEYYGSQTQYPALQNMQTASDLPKAVPVIISTHPDLESDPARRYPFHDTSADVFQTDDKMIHVKFRGLAQLPAKQPYYCFIVKDPADESPCAKRTGGHKADGDNFPVGVGNYGHLDAAAGVQHEHHGRVVYAVPDASGTVELTLAVTHYAGNNYRIDMTPVGKIKQTLKSSPVFVAWKRVYLELDRMYKHGAYLTEDVDVGDTVIHVTNARVFNTTDRKLVRLFDVGDASEQCTIKSINQQDGTLTLVAPVTHPYCNSSGWYGYVGIENTLYPMETQYLSRAYGHIAGSPGVVDPDGVQGKDGGCFVNFHVIPNDKNANRFLPCKKIISEGVLNDLSDVWEDQRGRTNVIQVQVLAYSATGAGEADITLKGLSDWPSFSRRVTWIFAAAAADVNPVGAYDSDRDLLSLYAYERADTLAHELGHQFIESDDVDADHTDNVYNCISGKAKISCIMDYPHGYDIGNTHLKAGRFCKKHCYQIRSYEDPFDGGLD